jgi:hypothetical protein
MAAYTFLGKGWSGNCTKGEECMNPHLQQILHDITVRITKMEEAQRTWVGLTDEEITTTSKETHFEPKPVAAFARAIEAKLKEKNT